MTDKVRIAVIGAGWWATEAHIPALLEHPQAELAALCDRDSDRLQKAAQAYGVERTYTDYRIMLQQEAPDGVTIATPHATHYPIAKYCLEHDRHIMLEKPMTLFASEAKELIDLAAQRRRELVVGHTLNYLPHHLRARAAIRSGELGAVQSVNCYYASDVFDFLSGQVGPDKLPMPFRVHGPNTDYSDAGLSGGEGHLQITHPASLMFFITGLRARRVHAIMHNHGLPVDLVDAILVDFEGEALGTVAGTGNGASRHKLDLMVYCEHGAVDIDSRAGTATVYMEDGSKRDLGPDVSFDRKWSYQPTQNLVDLILGQAENGSPGEVALRSVELLDAAYRSARQSGQGVMIADLY
ncbi:MAG: Gfo/Idh/MocA family oxidoreductase [Anaerolineae bacterium]|nr:Gfo/Idh/MocA family oxidoreductase [Anaerolineae bacterium]